MRVFKSKWLVAALFPLLFLFAFFFFTPTTHAIVQATGGDGFEPIVYQDKVFNIFHHKSPNGNPSSPEYNINCVIRDTGQICPTYPRYFSTTPGSSGNLSIGTPGAADIHIPTFPQAEIEGSRLFYPASTSANNGIGCFDLDLGINCSGTSFFNLGSVGATGSPSFTAKTEGVERVGNKLYSIGSDIAMYCLDIANALSPVACGSQPYPVNTGIEAQMPAYNGTFFFTVREVINNRIYTTVNYLTQTPSAPARITCFDTATNSRCAGWTSSALPDVAGSDNPHYWSIFSYLNTSGSPQAVCAASRVVDPVYCFDLTTQAPVAPAAFFAQAVAAGRTTGNPVIEELNIGSKTYFTLDSNPGGTMCWDFAAQAGCSGFGLNGYRSWDGTAGSGSVNGGNTRDYGYAAVGTCILGLGDAGVLWSFDGATGSLPGDESCALGPDCYDGGDNDGDGSIDFPTDTGCSTLADNTEIAAIFGSSIGNSVWFDYDGDGVKDPTEPGMSGITVNLSGTRDGPDDISGTGDDVAVNLSTTTDSSGAYSFSGLQSGQYSVAVTPPAGAVQTYDLDGLGTANSSGTFALGVNQQNSSVDFGYRGDSSLSGIVFNDSNNNNSPDPGESVRSSITVHLLSASGDIIATTTTDSNGAYIFDNLLAGTYGVRLVGIGGSSVNPVPGSGGGTAGDIDILGIAVAAGEDVIANNFAIIMAGGITPGLPNAGLQSIKDYIWLLGLAALSFLAAGLCWLHNRKAGFSHRLE